MATPPARHAARQAQRRAPRVRYDRLTALLGAWGVTLVAVLGGVGLLPVASASPRADDAATAAPSDRSADKGEDKATKGSKGRGGAVDVDGAKFDRSDREARRVARTALAVPADSGEGRRVVFDQTAQRVWLVGEAGKTERTYLVSGSAEDNLDPGSYEVYSRSEQAWGIDDSGTMKYMVRFAHGERAAIGFHDLPIKDGELLQTRAELGTPLSTGCVRQWRPDAKALWRFAPVGTPVVVVAT